jgi:hypothetical protein
MQPARNARHHLWDNDLDRNEAAPLARIVGAAESFAWLELPAFESCRSWRDDLREVRKKLAGAPEPVEITSGSRKPLKLSKKSLFKN